eukprot:TRINITY_DN32947_c0_g1_i1.p1 TRINITY_DN32947_c0_g1~~TRINITY_DN32947_c0_g1_i1.p1  ORF type:complete len:468 (+),score=82.76 TRINITY_DN32947_c0_g1_i1:135-1538(+)
MTVTGADSAMNPRAVPLHPALPAASPPPTATAPAASAGADLEAGQSEDERGSSSTIAGSSFQQLSASFRQQAVQVGDGLRGNAPGERILRTLSGVGISGLAAREAAGAAQELMTAEEQRVSGGESRSFVQRDLSQQRRAARPGAGTPQSTVRAYLRAWGQFTMKVMFILCLLSWAIREFVSIEALFSVLVENYATCCSSWHFNLVLRLYSLVNGTNSLYGTLRMVRMQSDDDANIIFRRFRRWFFLLPISTLLFYSAPHDCWRKGRNLNCFEILHDSLVWDQVAVFSGVFVLIYTVRGGFGPLHEFSQPPLDLSLALKLERVPFDAAIFDDVQCPKACSICFEEFDSSTDLREDTAVAGDTAVHDDGRVGEVKRQEPNGAVRVHFEGADLPLDGWHVQPIARMPCSPAHCFHIKCISEWLVRSGSCPCCRAPYDGASGASGRSFEATGASEQLTEVELSNRPNAANV